MPADLTPEQIAAIRGQIEQTPSTGAIKLPVHGAARLLDALDRYRHALAERNQDVEAAVAHRIRLGEMLSEAERERDDYAEELRGIAEADPVGMVLDPQRPQRIARAALARHEDTPDV